MTYGAIRMYLNRAGKRVLNKRVTPHMLRHSSATFYANKLNRYQLCYRYGWAFSSRMVDRYLDREGILEESTAIKVREDEISKANKDSGVLREDLSLVKEMNTDLTSEVQLLRDEIEDLKQGKGFMTILMNLARQQKEMATVLKGLSGREFDVVLQQGLRRV